MAEVLDFLRRHQQHLRLERQLAAIGAGGAHVRDAVGAVVRADILREFIAGEIDLSPAANMALSACLFAYSLQFGMPSPRTPEGRAFVKQLLKREVRISGLWHVRLDGSHTEITWDHAAFEFVRQPSEIIEPLRDVVKLAAHLVDELAVIGGFDLGEAAGSSAVTRICRSRCRSASTCGIWGAQGSTSRAIPCTWARLSRSAVTFRSGMECIS